MKRCLIIGYGSIGKRHAVVLKELGCHVSLVTAQQIESYPSYRSVQEALGRDFDYVVIANSTHLHHQTLLALIQHNFSGIVLVEKPLFAKNENLPNHQFKKIVVAYNLRFNSLLAQAKALVKNERLVTFTAYVGQYLPTWRQGANYSERYSAKKEFGGGVLRELSHELDYITWICGDCLQLTANGGQFSELNVTSDDVYSILMQTKRCPSVNLQMNCLDREARREIIINTVNKTVSVDLVNGILKVNGEMLSQDLEASKLTYQHQHEAILNKQFEECCNLEQAIKVMRLILAAERASQAQAWIALSV